MANSAGIARFRFVLWALVVVAAIGATGLYLFKPPAAPIGISGRPFTLQTTLGGTFTEANLKGTPSLMFFGYTFCPDVCPTTMAESVEWKDELGLKPEQLRTIFVTVDPQRDTREHLAEYLGAFDPNIVGLVGDEAQTEAIKTAFGIVAEKAAPDAQGNYLVNHTASVFLIGADGSFQGTIAYGEDKASALAKIKRLIGA